MGSQVVFQAKIFTIELGSRAMAKHLNQDQPTVSNTYQCYLKVKITGCLGTFPVQSAIYLTVWRMPIIPCNV